MCSSGTPSADGRTCENPTDIPYCDDTVNPTLCADCTIGFMWDAVNTECDPCTELDPDCLEFDEVAGVITVCDNGLDVAGDG